jgi:hypothetical protein
MHYFNLCSVMAWVRNWIMKRPLPTLLPIVLWHQACKELQGGSQHYVAATQPG